MGIKLQASNSLQILSDGLAQAISTQKMGVFQPNYIVTQTEGMNSWLTLELAEKLGISANFRFVKPNDLINEVYNLLGGKFLQPLSAQNQSWLLFKLLGDADFTHKFPTVSSYYKPGSIDSDLKRMSIAEKVADLFDQYQIYRPDLIREWNNATLENVGKNGWQQFLWISARRIFGDQLPDKTTMGSYILNELEKQDQQERLRQRMPFVHFFGLSVLTEFHIQLFHALGLYSDITFHLLNPAPDSYWMYDRSEKVMAFLRRKGWVDATETSTGNALLTTWGKVIRNTFDLLFQNDEMLNAYESIGAETPGKDTLLHVIQSDVFENVPDDERAQIPQTFLADGSLVINSCFTQVREVEVLYNYLVHLVDMRDTTLSARDIVVMVSNIDAYAPYIKAIFTHAPYHFPFTIADESFAANDSAGSALSFILQLNRDNFNAESVMQLLDSSYIRNRFGLSDLPLIRSIVSAANIRFGFSGNEADDTRFVSWQYGLKRIIYGICMSGGEVYDDGTEQLYPLDRIEGSGSLELIRFYHFVEVLMSSIDERATSRSISDWSAYVEQVLNNLVYDPEKEADEGLGILLKGLENYTVLHGIVSEEISFDVFNRSFLKSIASNTRSSSFAVGGITFCSLIPMRSIPFKVVALLGLNFDQFPRKENPVSFDLMELEKKKGDRNVKENDKHLFLETLLSSRECLYISYLGQSAKDNSNIPPSSLVDELIDYIQRKVEGKINVFNELVVRHPLHNFSGKYFQKEGGLYSYLNDKSEREELQEKVEKPEAAQIHEVSVTKFVAFYKHPVKAYYNDVLEVYYRDTPDLLSGTELFELDGLQEWTLKQHLVSADPATMEAVARKLVMTGMLPLKNSGSVAIQNLIEVIAPVRTLFNELTNGFEAEDIQVDFIDGNSEMKITGPIAIYGDKLVVINWSKNPLKYQIEGYLKLLLLSAMGIEADLYCIHALDATYKIVPRLTAAEATERLHALSAVYIEGHTDVIAFWPDFDISWDKLQTMEYNDFKKAVLSKFENFKFPVSDEYVLAKNINGFFMSEDAFASYSRVAGLILSPVEHYFT